MKTILFMSVISAAAFVAQSADARAIHFFRADLSGSQEVPPTPSLGTGIVDFEFDDVTSTLSITNGFFEGLLSPTTAAHVHGLAAPGVNAGIIFGVNIPLGVTSGSITGSGVLTPLQADGLFNGLLYLNVHTQQFPGGEIRGQLFIVPAPGALALLGLAGLIGSRRRRQ